MQNARSVGKRQYVPLVYVPGTRTRLLSEAGKMPCVSFSLPAKASCPHAYYQPDHAGHIAVCSRCYATGGNYRRRKNVPRAQRRRFDWAKQCMRTEAGRAHFVDHLVYGIRRASRSNKWFRGHDSGDFFSVAYVRCWIEICRATPDVRYWFPTRSWRALVASYKGQDERGRAAFEATKRDWALALSELASLPNVTIRNSALFVDVPAPMLPGFAAGTAVVTDLALVTCPAHKQGGACLECRACWVDVTKVTVYPLHN